MGNKKLENFESYGRIWWALNFSHQDNRMLVQFPRQRRSGSPAFVRLRQA